MAGLQSGSFTNPRYVEIAHFLTQGQELGLLAADYGWPHLNEPGMFARAPPPAPPAPAVNPPATQE